MDLQKKTGSTSGLNGFVGFHGFVKALLRHVPGSNVYLLYGFGGHDGSGNVITFDSFGFRL